MKAVIGAVMALFISAGVAHAAIGDKVCIKTGGGQVYCGEIIIQ